MNRTKATSAAALATTAGTVAPPMAGASTVPAAPALPPADLLPVQRAATTGYRVGRVLLQPVVRALFRFRVEGLANLPDGPYVLIANHLNWLDSFALLHKLPMEPRIHFLGDVEHLVDHRFQWWVIRKMGGFIPVAGARKGNPGLFQHVDRCLQRGGVVALYPEGKYGPREGELQSFHKGFAHFASTNGVPVVPVAISGCKELWWRKRISLTVGAPIDTAGLNVEELTALGRERLGALLPEYREPRGLKLFRKTLTGLL